MSLYDPGLQPERTELAWRRTALSIGVGSLIAARILPLALGEVAWAAIGLAGVVFAVFLWFGARRRYRDVNLALVEESRGLPGAGMLLTLAIFIVVAGIAATAVVIGAWIGQA